VRTIEKGNTLEKWSIYFFSRKRFSLWQKKNGCIYICIRKYFHKVFDDELCSTEIREPITYDGCFYVFQSIHERYYTRRLGHSSVIGSSCLMAIPTAHLVSFKNFLVLYHACNCLICCAIFCCRSIGNSGIIIFFKFISVDCCYFFFFIGILKKYEKCFRVYSCGRWWYYTQHEEIFKLYFIWMWFIGPIWGVFLVFICHIVQKLRTIYHTRSFCGEAIFFFWKVYKNKESLPML